MTSTPSAREIPFADPLAAMAAFADDPWVAFLDSAAPAPRQARYSFIAADPFLTMTAKDGRLTLGDQSFSGDPFLVLREVLQRHAMDRLADGPPFQGGAVGYFAYELGHHLERLPRPNRDDMQFPDMAIGFYDTVLAFDMIARRAWIVSTGLPEPAGPARQTRAIERSASLARRLESVRGLPRLPRLARPVAWRSNFTRPAYERMVARIIEYIRAGDIFQANFTQRFLADMPAGHTPFDLYRRLRAVNPAPFAAFLACGDTHLASASPERFLRLADGQVETRPIKGTRPRGASPAADAAEASALLTREKDRAENVMIDDLLRNDLSRVCQPGSVTTPEICTLESFATVHHLVSTVQGALAADSDAVDLLRATFPGGSITGAPKIRAMEIIAELEPVARGPYCGSIGYVGFDGSLDTSITIRTMAIRDGRVAVQAGGGIVADSDPAAEYAESLAKARALLDCLSPVRAAS
ncbi:MAG: aminodeoxychorismate synthase component I [Alphaproteobacteria bacterium]